VSARDGVGQQVGHTQINGLKLHASVWSGTAAS